MKTPRIIVDATEEPVSLDAMRLHLNVDAYDSPATHPHDSLIQALTATARQRAEKFTGRTLVTKTLQLDLDGFPSGSPWTASAEQLAIHLPGSPVQSIVSFRYIDGGGVLQDLTDYQFDMAAAPARLMPAPGMCWPTTQAMRLNSVSVRYVAGYTQPDESPSYETIPKELVQAIKLMVGHWYENREDTSVVNLTSIPLGAEACMRPYRLERAMA